MNIGKGKIDETLDNDIAEEGTFRSTISQEASSLGCQAISLLVSSDKNWLRFSHVHVAFLSYSLAYGTHFNNRESIKDKYIIDQNFIVNLHLRTAPKWWQFSAVTQGDKCTMPRIHR